MRRTTIWSMLAGALASVLASVLATVVWVSPAAAASYAVQPSGQPIDGGPAATQATAVEPGTAYTDDVRAGEARWYSFPAGSGQVAGVTFTEPGTVEYDCCLAITLYDSDFEQLTFEGSLSNTDGTAQTTRSETDEEGLDEPGTYYVEVVLDEEAAIRPVPYEFTVDVTGDAAQSPTPTTQPPSEPPSEPATSEPATAEPTQDAAAAAGDDSGGSTLLWVVVALLGVLVLLLAVALVFLFTRLQRQGPPTR